MSQGQEVPQEWTKELTDRRKAAGEKLAEKWTPEMIKSVGDAREQGKSLIPVVCGNTHLHKSKDDTYARIAEGSVIDNGKPSYLVLLGMMSRFYKFAVRPRSRSDDGDANWSKVSVLSCTGEDVTGVDGDVLVMYVHKDTQPMTSLYNAGAAGTQQAFPIACTCGDWVHNRHKKLASKDRGRAERGCKHMWAVSRVLKSQLQ